LAKKNRFRTEPTGFGRKNWFCTEPEGSGKKLASSIQNQFEAVQGVGLNRSGLETGRTGQFYWFWFGFGNYGAWYVKMDAYFLS
jgi:hypothetical protein